MTMDFISVHIDGACGPINPGGTVSYGILIKYPNGYVYHHGEIIGSGPTMSNNVAEYSALVKALKELMLEGKENEKIVIHSDSQLVVNQMLGKWRVRRGLYIKMFSKARSLANCFKQLEFKWIPRELNTDADLLSKQALEEHG